MNKYAEGKIYAIMSYQTNKIYIGSTCSSLNTRFSNHKYSSLSSKEITQYDDAYIQIIRVYPCNTRSDLERMEGYYQEKYKDIIVNKNRSYGFGGATPNNISPPKPRISRVDSNGPYSLK
jgi:hypothetical protein